MVAFVGSQLYLNEEELIASIRVAPFRVAPFRIAKFLSFSPRGGVCQCTLLSSSGTAQ